MSLSVVIATLNESDQCLETLRSIRATAGDVPEVVIVDDGSGTPYELDWRFGEFKNTRIITNRYRCGCGPARHIGALRAKGDWLLFVDSHMRFTKGWYEKAYEHVLGLDGEGFDGFDCPKDLWCATCLGLDEKGNQTSGPYHGATYNLHGVDRNKPALTQTLECVWLKPGELPQEQGSPLPAVMGACYALSREWFLHLGATRFLRSWGGDELMLSMKCWLAGGEVRLLKSVEIGHIFPPEGTRKPFNLPPGSVQWNKIMAAHTLFDAETAKRLERLVLDETQEPDRQAALDMKRRDWHIIAQEQAYNATIFNRTPQWLCDKFGLKMP